MCGGKEAKCYIRSREARDPEGLGEITMANYFAARGTSGDWLQLTTDGGNILLKVFCNGELELDHVVPVEFITSLLTDALDRYGSAREAMYAMNRSDAEALSSLIYSNPYWYLEE